MCQKDSLETDFARARKGGRGVFRVAGALALCTAAMCVHAGVTAISFPLLVSVSREGYVNVSPQLPSAAAGSFVAVERRRVWGSYLGAVAARLGLQTVVALGALGVCFWRARTRWRYPRRVAAGPFLVGISLGLLCGALVAGLCQLGANRSSSWDWDWKVVALSDAYLGVVLAVVFGVLLGGKGRWCAAGGTDDVCPRCGYSLAGLAVPACDDLGPRCPECSFQRGYDDTHT